MSIPKRPVNVETGKQGFQEINRTEATTDLGGITQDLDGRQDATLWGLNQRGVETVEVISDTGLYKGGQSYDRQRVFELMMKNGQFEKVRTTLHRDAFDNQSRYRAEVWNDNDKTWNEVASIPGAHSSVTENYDPQYGMPRYVCFDMDKANGARAGQAECHLSMERVNRDLLRSTATILE